MKRLSFALIGSGLLAFSPASPAQSPAPVPPPPAAAAAPATVDPATPAPATPALAVAPATAAPEKRSDSDRPYVSAALSFLRGLSRSARTGEAGEKGWAEARENAGDTVALKLSGKDLVIDLAGKKSDARLLRFSKVSTLRDGATIKGVTAENVQMQLGEEPHSGKAWLLMEATDGKWRVTSMEVD
ncbi:MAG: hypothetical protein NVS2B9_17540 [Myxococcales bacterium]